MSVSPQGDNSDPNPGKVNEDRLRTMNFRNNVIVSHQGDNSDPNPGKVNEVIENIELQEQF